MCLKPLCNYNLLSIHQSGFRKHHSRETGLAALASERYKHLDNNKMIGYINIYLKNAFDLINFEILCKKLVCYGCNEFTVSWFASYLIDRKQSICIKKFQSQMMPTQHGVCTPGINCLAPV